MERTNTSLSTEIGKTIYASSQLTMFNVLKDFESNSKLLNIWKTFSIRENVTESIIYYDSYTVQATDWWDSISYYVYGECNYWWVIALVNGIINPFEELYPGMQLKILKKKYMYQLIKEIRVLSTL